MSFSSTTSQDSTTYEHPTKNNQITNDIFLSENALHRSTTESQFDEQALKDAALQDEYQQACLMHNIIPDPNITIDQLRVLSDSANVELIQSPYINPIPDNEPLDFDLDTEMEEVEVHSHTAGKRPRKTG